MTKEELQAKFYAYLLEIDKEEKAENTINQYKHHVSVFLGFIKKDITPRTAREFKELLLDDDILSINTINQYVVSINKFLRYSGLNDYTTKQERVQKKHSLEEVLEPTEYIRLLKYAKSNNDMDFYYIMKIFAETGIRRGELKFFTYENLNKKSNKFIMEVRNKGKHRKIYLPQELSRELRDYASSKDITHGTIFPGRNGVSMWSYSTIHRHLKSIAGSARVKLTKVHPHAFRHLFARSYLEENPEDIIGLAAIFGHERTDTTEIYVMTTDEEKLRRLEKISYRKSAGEITEVDSFRQGILAAVETMLYESNEIETAISILNEHSIPIDELSKRSIKKIQKIDEDLLEI